MRVETSVHTTMGVGNWIGEGAEINGFPTFIMGTGTPVLGLVAGDIIIRTTIK